MNDRPTTILFDLDGTVANSLPVLKAVYRDFLAAYGFEGTDSEFAVLNGMTVREMVSYLSSKHHLSVGEGELTARYQELLSYAYANKVQLFDGVLAVLSELKNAGFRLGLVTSAPGHLVRPLLSRLKMDEVFERVISGGPGIPGKPHPKLYEMALEAFKADAKETVVVEDSENGIVAAEKSGVKTILRFGGQWKAGQRTFNKWPELTKVLNRIEGARTSESIESGFKLSLTERTRTFSKDTEDEIRQIWEKENSRRANEMHDSPLLIYGRRVSDAEVQCYFIPYRYYFAQRVKPDLFAGEPLEAISVSGLLQVEDALLFGLRGGAVTAYPNTWELVPSGGIDQTSERTGYVDYCGQIISELCEETPFTKQSIESVQPFALVHSPEDFVWDIGIRLRSRMKKADVLSMLKNTNEEYERFELVSLSEAKSFIRKRRCVPASNELVSFYIREHR